MEIGITLSKNQLESSNFGAYNRALKKRIAIEKEYLKHCQNVLNLIAKYNHKI